MEKLDLTKKYKLYYTAKAEPEVVEIERVNFISICGKGDPSGKPFGESLEALYSTAYALKFSFKAKHKDFVVAKLEGLWWFDETKYAGKNISNASVDIPKSEWEYRLLIRMPDFITPEDVEKSKEAAYIKKSMVGIRHVEYFTMAEGKCVQMLHVGPYSTEPETLKVIGTFCEAAGFVKNGSHHEIYLSDFRKTKAEKLKTILREPVK